jgi:hypothetical protein
MLLVVNRKENIRVRKKAFIIRNRESQLAVGLGSKLA